MLLGNPSLLLALLSALWAVWRALRACINDSRWLLEVDAFKIGFLRLLGGGGSMEFPVRAEWYEDSRGRTS